MSTIDPRVARIQSHDVAFTGTVAAWLAAFLAVLHILVWVVAALAAASTLDVLRALIVDSGESETSSRLLAGWPLVALALLGFMLGAGLHSAAERVTSDGAASSLRLATATIGLTIGLVGFAGSWTPPLLVGSRTAYFGDGARPWGILEWVAYWAPVWLAVLTGVLAVATTVMAAALIVRRRVSQQRVVEVLADGMHTSGHLSEVRSGEPDGKGRAEVHVTVTYVDRTGQRRWVEKVIQLYKDEIPEVGAPAEVWYDRERLNDTDRIAVDVHRAGRDRPQESTDAAD